MSIIYTPIKSQGGKTKLIPLIMAVRGELTGRWIEPFLGTGVVAFNSGAKSALLSDINPHIIRLYSDIQKDIITPEIAHNYLQIEGANLACAGDNGYDHYKFIKKRFNTFYDPLDYMFLTRTCYKGLCKFNKRGEWSVTFCKNPNKMSQKYINSITNNIKQCRERMTSDWTFVCSDFREIIKQAKEDDVIYCDPPYAGRDTRYYSSWSERDDQDLFDLLGQTKARFILSSWYRDERRINSHITKYKQKYNIITKQHIYRMSFQRDPCQRIEEALVLNFPVPQNVNASQIDLFNVDNTYNN